jgi:hypothetical protein
MKRIVIIAAGLVFAASIAAAAETSPDRSHVKISVVPRQCLENGSAEADGYKYTCTKVDSSDVWNEAELRRFEKEIFEASRQPIGITQIGLVVRQDTRYTREEQDYKNEVAVVEKRDGYKYRYAHR